MGTGGSSPEVKGQGYEADHSSPSSVKVRNGGAIPPHPHTPLWHGAKLIKHREIFTFIFPMGYTD
jgi:hypothetical protein